MKWHDDYMVSYDFIWPQALMKVKAYLHCRLDARYFIVGVMIELHLSMPFSFDIFIHDVKLS